MSVFVDTTALYALVDADDDRHDDAVGRWRRLAEAAERLVTHNLVLAECISLVQSRIGLPGVRDLLALAEPVDVVWIGPEEHDLAVVALFAGRRRRVSYVDHVSFRVMRSQDIDRALAFDRHFTAEGFQFV